MTNKQGVIKYSVNMHGNEANRFRAFDYSCMTLINCAFYFSDLFVLFFQWRRVE